MESLPLIEAPGRLARGTAYLVLENIRQVESGATSGFSQKARAIERAQPDERVIQCPLPGNS